jgi:hypothetical protein
MSVKKNLDLAFALVRQAAADEDFAAELTAASSEGPMLLIPADDPELAQANETVAVALAARGERFTVLRVARALAPRRT